MMTVFTVAVALVASSTADGVPQSYALAFPEERPQLTVLTYSDGYLWAGAATSEVWRFDATGRGERFSFPTESAPRRFAPHGATADVIFVSGNIYRIDEHGSAEFRLSLDPFSTDAVPVDGGYIGFSRGRDELLYLRARRGDGRLDVESLGAVDGDKLMRVDAVTVAVLSDLPYRLTVVDTGGARRSSPLDESAVAALQPAVFAGRQYHSVSIDDEAKRAIETVAVADGVLEPWTAVTVRAFAAGGLIVLDRRMDERVGDAAGSRHFIDFVHSESSKVVERLDAARWRAPGWQGSLGHVVVGFEELQLVSYDYRGLVKFAGPVPSNRSLWARRQAKSGGSARAPTSPR